MRQQVAIEVVRVVATDAHEGPVYVPDEDALYFTTVPRPTAPGAPETQIKRLALDGDRLPVEPERVTLVREEANMANGMALDHEGRLVICEQGDRLRDARITRLDPRTSESEILVDGWAGLRLNSPNDVVVASDGALWFTDPGYGFLQGFRPPPLLGDYVYRYDPLADHLAVVSASLDKPNGLCFSPDGSVLYVADNGAPHRIVAFDVADGRLERGRVFAVSTPGFPDGMKVDVDGRVYAASSGGVQILAPSGDLLGEIELPGAVNFAFGGPENNVLFITADTAIWAAVLETKGA
jgi:gluconolactonase